VGGAASGWAAQGDPGVLRIVFPEGCSARQMADRVARYGVSRSTGVTSRRDCRAVRDVRKPDRIHHFFTADDEEFCQKAREYGYSC
jgi:hypothetical protein